MPRPSSIRRERRRARGQGRRGDGCGVDPGAGGEAVGGDSGEPDGGERKHVDERDDEREVSMARG